MSRVLAVKREPVRIGECECPDTPHADGDHAYLRPRLSPEGGMAAAFVLTELEKGDTLVDYMRVMGMVLIEDGLVAWDVLDDDGEPAPFDKASIRSGMYDYESTLKPIIDRAFELYEASVMRPLQQMAQRQKSEASTSSNSGPTPGPTSASSESSEPTRVPSGPSTTPSTRPVPSRG